MLALLAAATAVTLVVNTADDKVSSSDGVLSLREAIARANASTKPHVIIFRGKGLGYQFMKSATPEGYRMELISTSTASVLLGTKLVQGKLVDGSP
jgi:hypothetical protein